MLVGRGAAHSGVLAAARLSSVVCAARGEREREKEERRGSKRALATVLC